MLAVLATRLIAEQGLVAIASSTATKETSTVTLDPVKSEIVAHVSKTVR